MRVAAIAALTAAGALASGCGANHADDPGDDPPPAAMDTVRGVVEVVGADPLTRVVIRPATGPSIEIGGALADTLRRAAGLDVRVAGVRDGGRMEARSFRVRGLEGLAAADGILEVAGPGVVVLVTGDGTRLRYPGASAGLMALAGLRVWIAGEPDAAPEQWGVLDP